MIHPCKYSPVPVAEYVTNRIDNQLNNDENS